MFKFDEKTELNQISLTGIRALLLVGLLIIKPRTLKEIKEIFIEYKIMDKSSSDDILRIDFNTIKLIGCDISRASSKTDYKYILKSHPFGLTVTEKEVSILKKIYKYLILNTDIKLILDLDELFKKLAFYICDEKSKEAILGISILKYYDVDLIKDLLLDCAKKNVLTLIYEKTTSTSQNKKQILAQRIVFNNNKIYLYGYDIDSKKSIVLNIRRIKSILSRKFIKQNIEIDQVKVLFRLKNTRLGKLELNEEIVEKFEEDSLIEGYYHNDFLAMQRVLSFGSDCIVVEPLEIKNNIIAKIKEMRETYVRK